MSPKNETKENSRTIPFDSFDEEFLKWFPIYYDRFIKESERGLSIISAALMDNALQKLLQAKLVPSPTAEDTLFDGSYSPLNSFAAKIDFAYRIGAIGQNMRSSLRLIRKIRNDFAHSTLEITFKSQSIHDRIKELFNLNRYLLDHSGDIISKDVESRVIKKIDHPEIKQVIDATFQETGLEYLVKFGGWKFTFSLLCALNAARLLAFNKITQPLVAI